MDFKTYIDRVEIELDAAMLKQREKLLEKYQFDALHVSQYVLYFNRTLVFLGSLQQYY